MTTAVVIGLLAVGLLAVLVLVVLAVVGLRSRPETVEAELLEPETVEEFAVVMAAQSAMEMTHDVDRALTLGMLGLRNYASPEDVAQLLATLERNLRVQHGRLWFERPAALAAIECWDLQSGLRELQADTPRGGLVTVTPV